MAVGKLELPSRALKHLLMRTSHRVFASPSMHNMDSKAQQTIITYPDIYFTIDNFDDVFGETVVLDGESLCVELVAAMRGHEDRYRSSVFRGMVDYEALRAAFYQRVRARVRPAHCRGARIRHTAARAAGAAGDAEPDPECHSTLAEPTQS